MQIGDKVRVKSYIPHDGRRTGEVVERSSQAFFAWVIRFDDDNHEYATFFESELDIISTTAPQTARFMYFLDSQVVISIEAIVEAAQGDSLPTQWNERALDVFLQLIGNCKEVAS